jgi:hypothetical protein
MPTYQCRSYSLAGSPEEWLADDDGSPAPPEAVAALNRRVAMKSMRWMGWKRAGPPEKAQTADERRLTMYESGMSYAEIGDHDGIDDLSNVRRSINRGRKRRERRAGQ